MSLDYRVEEVTVINSWSGLMGGRRMDYKGFDCLLNFKFKLTENYH